MKATLYLAIGKTMYAVTKIDAHKDAAVKAWRLRGMKQTYDVALTSEGLASCSCADGTYRANEKPCCKHYASLVEVGLLPKR